MSADNGVYVLETGTDKKEYRVAHLQAVENINYNESAPDPEYCPNRNTYSLKHNPKTCPSCIAYENKFYNEDPDVMIKNARKMWEKCKVYTDELEALEVASKMYREILDDCGICEYGIQSLVIPRDF